MKSADSSDFVKQVINTNKKSIFQFDNTCSSHACDYYTQKRSVACDTTKKWHGSQGCSKDYCITRLLSIDIYR